MRGTLSGDRAHGVPGTSSVHPSPTEVLKTLSAIINAGSSANLSMFHGGTNFGFIGGAVHFQDYKSDVTSYGKYPRRGAPRPCLGSRGASLGDSSWHL